MTRYLCYNPSGPASDSLRSNKPGDVTLVPWGWTDEIETARNQLLASLGLSGVSSLPCILHEVLEREVDDGEGGTVTIPAHWEERRFVEQDPVRWTWANINDWTNNPIMRGDQVEHEGKTYESLVDWNIWVPGAPGTENIWREVVNVPENVWQAGIQVTVNETYFYPDLNGTEYRVVQSHTTQLGWEPPNVPALFQPV